MRLIRHAVNKRCFCVLFCTALTCSLGLASFCLELLCSMYKWYVFYDHRNISHDFDHVHDW